MSGEVSWEEENEVREVIADIRDADCELDWVVFGYGPGQSKILTVVGAGDGGLEQLRANLDDSQIMFAFLQLEERAFAFIHWCPEGASGTSRTKAAIHRSFITKYLGNIAVDLQAHSLADLTQEKMDEELSYYHSTSGRQLDGSEAEKRLLEQEERKRDTVKRQALAGNTHEAQKTLAKLIATSNSTETKILPKVSGTNVSKKAPPKHSSSALFEKAKISVELEDEENLKELMLDLREAEIDGDFNWMILTYVEDKKNTLALMETGNGGRKGLVEYLRAEHNGGLDKILYMLIKEDETSNKCTFVCWIGRSVPAFQRANCSTHRGAISNWMSTVVHNLKEEYVQSGNHLLGLKDEEPDTNGTNDGSGEAALGAQTSSIIEVEKKMQSKSYIGKVLDGVKRDKTPQEMWMERKQQGQQGSGKASSPSDHRNRPSGEHSCLDQSAFSTQDPEKDFTQIHLKSRSGSSRSLGRSKYAKKTSDGGAGAGTHASDVACGDVSGMSKSELRAAAQQAAAEAGRLEEEAAMKRAAAKKWQQAAMDADGSESEAAGSAAGAREGSCGGGFGSQDEGIGGPDSASASPPEEQPLLLDEADFDPPASQQEARGGHDRDQARLREQEEAAASAVTTAKEALRRESEQREKAARVKAEDEATVKAEAEVRAEAERKAKTDQQARLQAETEAKAAVEQEQARLKAEAEASEAKRKAEAERQEARLKAEASAKAEEERKAKLAAEEERARLEAGAEKDAARREAEEREQARYKAEAAAAAAMEAELKAKAEAERKARAAAEEEEQRRKEVEAQAREAERRAKAAAEEELRVQSEAETERKPPGGAGGGQASQPPSPPSAMLQSALAERKAALLAQVGAGSAPSQLPAGDGVTSATKRPEAAPAAAGVPAATAAGDQAAIARRNDDDALRRKTEELLARKKALLEDAARLRAASGSSAAPAHRNGDSSVGTDSGATGRVDAATAAAEDYRRRAQEYRQMKLAELASIRGAAGTDSTAAAKKAAFLQQADESVKRAALQDAANKRVDELRHPAI